MNNEARKTLADNLGRLMGTDTKFGSQMKLAKLASRPGGANVGQTTISIMLRPDHEVSPTLETIEAVAAVFKLQAWELLCPNLKIGTVHRFSQAKDGALAKGLTRGAR